MCLQIKMQQISIQNYFQCFQTGFYLGDLSNESIMEQMMSNNGFDFFIILTLLQLVQNSYFALNETFLIDKPSLIEWTNKNHMEQRLILCKTQITNKIIGKQKLVLPSDFIFDSSNSLISYSQDIGHVYDFSQITMNVIVQFIHIVNGTVQSEGVLHSEGEQISQLFAIQPVYNYEQDYHQQCSFIVSPNSQKFTNVYQIQKGMYSTEPSCSKLSPMSQQLWAQKQCQSLSMTIMIESNYYIKEYQQYRLSQNILEVDLLSDSTTFKVMMNSHNNQIDYTYRATQLQFANAGSFEAEAKWQPDLQMITVMVQNLSQDEIYLRCRCVSNSFQHFNKILIFRPEETKNFGIKIYQFLSSLKQVQIILGDNNVNIKLRVNLLNEIDEIKQEVNDNIYEKQVIQSEKTKIYIIVISVSLTVFICLIIGCAIRIRRSVKKSDTDEKDGVDASTKKIDGKSDSKQDKKCGKQGQQKQNKQNCDFAQGISDIMPRITQDNLRGVGYDLDDIRVPDF